jgi:hypothetical protein
MSIKKDYISFQDEIAERGITRLVHFTSTENLLSIFHEKKILSRSRLESENVSYQDTLDLMDFNDGLRYDDKSYINLSIEHPNVKLFNAFKRNAKENIYIYWCVITLDTSLIYQENTLFSVTNAANGANKSYINGSLNTFRAMFAPALQITTSYNSSILSRQNGLLAKYPTDIQAEVLAKDEIDVSFIKNIYFPSEEEKQFCETAFLMERLSIDKFIVDKSLFKAERL